VLIRFVWRERGYKRIEEHLCDDLGAVPVVLNDVARRADGKYLLAEELPA
jgi:hypothetical protein